MRQLPKQPDKAVPFWKRCLDLALLLVLSPIVLPLMGLIAVGIYIVSPGPILFRQERVGIRGRRFTCLKFRSMVTTADSSEHQKHFETTFFTRAPLEKMDRTDKRIIPFGVIFRASGLDELPQLFNVLRGDMSIVGPRPGIPYEYELYDDHQKSRFNCLPGLTGYWQVTGKNSTTFDEMIERDLYYTRNMSLGLDLRILLCTFPTILQQVLELKKKAPAVEVKSNEMQRKDELLVN